jgi:hypothetical protein
MVSRDDLGIIKKIDEHIKGTTNPYVQVVESSAGRKARTCRGPKVTMSTLSASSTLLASLTITSACNPDKLELVEVKIENINRKKEKNQDSSGHRCKHQCVRAGDLAKVRSLS